MIGGLLSERPNMENEMNILPHRFSGLSNFFIIETVVVSLVITSLGTCSSWAQESGVAVREDEKTVKNIADIPEGITSFGGAVMGQQMFVYGGHTGDAHSYYESGQNKTLFAIDLNSPREWKAVGQGLGLQGLAMVAHDGKLYRLGGFHAHNKKGEKHDLRSVNEFAVFDFETKKWKQLQPMPEARSSFDAVVKDGKIYIVGGWAMNGQKSTAWCETAYVYDLTQDNPKWNKLPNPPFKRRALSVGYQGNKIIAIGGMQEKGGPTTKVAILDLNDNKWSDGPALPDNGRMEGFGTSCFNIGGHLVVSTYGGKVYQLNKSATEWVPIAELDEGRFFHRLLPIGSKQFALVGGASMETGKFYEVEILSTK